MGILHFINVCNGDCSVIQHPSGRTTVIDVCNAFEETTAQRQLNKLIAKSLGVQGNFNQKRYPVNPISYLRNLGIESVFRFILTHPDMDHLAGVKAFFEAFSPVNFWDTANTAEKDFGDGGPYDEQDWLFYESLRDGNPATDPKRLELYAGAHGAFYNQDENGNGGGDGLHVLAPTRRLIRAANRLEDFNDGGYVILYRSTGGRVLFAGDSHDETWEHILANHADDVRNVDL